MLGNTSLAFHALHFNFGADRTGAEGGRTPAQIVKEIRAAYPDSAWKFETPENRRDSLGDSMDNFQQFLGMVALASLVLGAIGVAGAVHAQVNRRVATIAMLRCLGCPANLAFAIYVIQALALGLMGALIGAALGIALHLGALTFFRESLPVAVDVAPVWSVVAQTTAAGLAVCGAFALMPLLRIRRISPGATLRDGASLAGEGGRSASWPGALFLLTVLTAAAVFNSAHWWRALAMTGGLSLAFVLLAGTARGLVAVTRRLVRPSWPYLLRQGISNLYRPHNQTLLFLLSLGFGTFLLVTNLLMRNVLRARIDAGHFAESPNVYLVDVQPDQLAGVLNLVLAGALLISTGLSVGGGLALSRGVCRHPPLEVLRKS